MVATAAQRGTIGATMTSDQTHPALLVRLLGSQPTAALVTLRREIATDLGRAENAARQLMMDLREVDRVLADRDDHEPDLFSNPPQLPAVPLKTAILRVLNEDPQRWWHRDELFGEVVARGWGPGGANPRNTFTSRLRDLEKDKRVGRQGRDHFRSVKNEEVPAV